MNNNINTDDVDFDTLTLHDNTLILKLLLPYLDYDKQLFLAIFIRIIEFKMTLEFFQNPMCPYRVKKDFTPSKILEEIGPKCPKEYKKIFENINIIMNMSQYMDIFSKADDIATAFTSLSNSAAPNDTNTANILMNLLSPNQQELYKKYCNDLNN